jgi:membrane fusion protein, multidrug efflux system
LKINHLDIINKNFMKKIYSIALVILTLTACKQEAPDKKTLLADLKKQQAELNSKVSTLEKELGKSDTTKKVKMNYIQITSAMPTTFSHYMEMQGAVVAEDEYFINAKAAGALKKVNVSVGSRVSAGQIVAEIDDDILQNQMDEIVKRYELVKDIYEKQDALWKQNIGSEVQLLSAKNNKEALEKSMATLTKSREFYKIVAPISGVVDEVLQPKVVNFAKLKFKAEVPESYAGKVRAGNSVVINFPDLKKDMSAKISYIGNTVNPMNRTFKVEVPLRANEPNMIPNLAGVMKVADYSNSNAYVIPINIIKKDLDGSDFVLIENGGKAAKAVVKVGQYYGDTAEILSGLKSGDKLITVGHEDLSVGDAVQIQ